MNLWRDMIREYGNDLQGLRWAVAGKLYGAHHASAGQNPPPLTDRDRAVKVSWLYRADALIRRVKDATKVSDGIDSIPAGAGSYMQSNDRDAPRGCPPQHADQDNLGI